VTREPSSSKITAPELTAAIKILFDLQDKNLCYPNLHENAINRLDKEA
jgi:hypothetical protein